MKTNLICENLIFFPEKIQVHRMFVIYFLISMRFLFCTRVYSQLPYNFNLLLHFFGFTDLKRLTINTINKDYHFLCSVYNSIYYKLDFPKSRYLCCLVPQVSINVGKFILISKVVVRILTQSLNV
mgnify:CR=1 FL=1